MENRRPSTSQGLREKVAPSTSRVSDIELTLLIGQYAQAYYLHEREVSGKVTERVHHFKDYLPTYFHLLPSPRNQIWMAKNPLVWGPEVVPEVKP